MLRRLHICPNAYYNYRKHRKAGYYTQKSEVQTQIRDIYHAHKGVNGYRSMAVYLARRGYTYSPATIHKYMNTEMGLRSVVRRKKPEYVHSKPHRIFGNKLLEDFTAEKPNQKWCTHFTYLFLKNHDVRYNCTIIDLCKPHRIFGNKLLEDFTAEKPNQKWCTHFTYLFLKNHDVRYNCTIIDLYDRSVVASITDRHITSDLAIRTLQKALDLQPVINDGLILHSDQGTQYTSKAFTEFCESVKVTQSMSKAGYPYDNAPMERYFNTLKNECTNLYEFVTEDALYQKVEEFAYVDYNHVRPHSFNGYRTPYETRMAA